MRKSLLLASTVLALAGCAAQPNTDIVPSPAHQLAEYCATEAASRNPTPPECRGTSYVSPTDASPNYKPRRSRKPPQGAAGGCNPILDTSERMPERPAELGIPPSTNPTAC
jgi:hypothetical protein